MNVYKCKSCDCGPCYHCSKNGVTEDPYSGVEDFSPCYCPLSGENSQAEWEKVINPARTGRDLFGSLYEWLNGDGYDTASEPLRDAIMAGGFEPSRRWEIDARKGIAMYDEFRELCYEWDGADLEEFKKRMAKINKVDAVIGVWSRAFQTGLMYAERLRVSLEEKNTK